MKHFLSIESLSSEELSRTLATAHEIKSAKGGNEEQVLKGQIWGLMFSKSSTRTRVSFEVGIRQLGGEVFFLASSEIQLGRGEPIKDTARVMGRMIDGAVIRTFEQNDVEEFASFSGVPTINALTDAEHPCQIIADLLTINEQFGSFEGKTVCFVGDGDCNVAWSWIWAAAKLGFDLRVAAPELYQPAKKQFSQVNAPNISVTSDIRAAAEGADVLYTDVWVSMGKEAEADFRVAQLSAYQLDEDLRKLAKPETMVMHCLPAYRGKEISDELFEANATTIFDQAENRLHAQKAILKLLVEG